MNETQLKHLAGLFDADGSIGIDYTNNRPYLTLRLTSAASIDKVGYVYNLPQLTGFGTSCKKTPRGGWSQISVWTVSKAKDLEMLVPRLVKHLVIKGAHLSRMFDKWQEYRGQTLTDLEKDQLNIYLKASRLASGPVKPRKHPSWAWVAGYLDGDGSYIFKRPPSQATPRMLVQATAHENDRVGLDLLFKAFGGSLNNRGDSSPHIWDWKHSLGKSNQAFAIRFLTKVVKHSILKKHKIEQLLAVCHSRTRTD